MQLKEYLVIAAAGFLSAIIKNGVGVGAGIFLLPVLALAFPAKVALGIGGPLMLGSDILGIRNYWRQWSSRTIVRLMLPAVPGLIIGTWLIPIIPAPLFRAGVGIFGMLYALCLFFGRTRGMAALRQRLPSCRLPDAAGAAFFGALGGVATVLAHAGGLVWSMYLMTTCHDRRVFVGTIVCMFCLTNIYKVIAYLNIGVLTPEHFFLTLLAMPAIFLGAAIGNIANKKVNQELFRRVVLGVIFVVSASLVCN